MKYPKAIVNTNYLRHNIQQIRCLAPQSKIIAVVKANAYGHGLIEVASALHKSVEGFGVARIAEAERLRDAGITNQILLLEGFVGAVELFKLNELNLATVIHSYEQLELIEHYNQHLQNISIWIKFNTGMNRLGLDANEVFEVRRRLEKLSCIANVNLMTHLANADNDEMKEYTKMQLENYAQVQKNLQVANSISATSGILFYPETRLDWIRPGIMLYGISPNYIPIKEQGFIPVLELQTNLIHIFKLKAGEILPGEKIKVSEDTFIGVIALGYGDGYPHHAPPGTPFLINGRKVTLIGRVHSDVIYIDLGRNCTDKIGDQVLVFGHDLPVEEVASHIKVITYEMTTSLTGRIKHEYIIN